jgi:transcriptional regulator with XRE-family HTH domain
MAVHVEYDIGRLAAGCRLPKGVGQRNVIDRQLNRIWPREADRRRRASFREASVTNIANKIDKYVGSRVKARRQELGVSQEKLGNALGVTFQQIQKYEKGTNRISASRLQQIGSVLGVPAAFFFEGLQELTAEMSGFAETPAVPYAADVVSTDEGLQLIRAFMRIQDPTMRRRIVEFIESIANLSSQTR